VFGSVGAWNPLHSCDGTVGPVAGAYIFGCRGTALSEDEKSFFRAADPWGFILFARNVESPDQLRALTSEMREAVGREAPILIDQEGGRVARLRQPDWLEWLPALDQMACTKPGQGARAMWLRYRLIADELRKLGIDANCAPIADIPTDEVHPIIRNRCYGGDAATVAGAGRAVADGLLAGGVLPVLKHIPGHGRPTTDSHKELPRTSVDLATLQATDFAPFKALADLPLGMTAHVVYEAIDPDNCATLSKAAITMIRQDIGFDGLLMTDDLSMSALSGSFTERTAASLAAGCDLVLHCHGDMGEMNEIASEAGKLSDPAQRRADRALGFRVAPDEIDQEAFLAELDDLLMLHGDERDFTP